MAGSLLGNPVELVVGKHTGLPIPAAAELVVEGEIPPISEEAREEGPFGEWTGYYASNMRKEAVIRSSECCTE
jgi:UbiD family decarboxylase